MIVGIAALFAAIHFNQTHFGKVHVMSEKNKSGIEYWKKIVVVMSLGWVAIWIYRTVLTPIYPEIQASLGNVSNAEIGAIASFYFFAYCSMQIPCGILVDKLGQKIMLMCGFTLFIIGTLSIAKATGLVMIYAGSLMAGAGCASFFSSAYSLSSANVPQARRALANAIINSGSAIGMGIGLIGSSVLVKSMSMARQKRSVPCCRCAGGDAVRIYIGNPWQGKKRNACVRPESTDGYDDRREESAAVFGSVVQRLLPLLLYLLWLLPDCDTASVLSAD